MKFLIALLAISAATCHNPFLKHLTTKSDALTSSNIEPQFEKMFSELNKIQTQMEQDQGQKSQTFVVEQKVPSSRYDTCLDDIQPIVKDFIEIAKVCIDQRWQDTIPMFLDAMKGVATTVECFINVSKDKLGVDLQCIMDHLKLASQDVQNVLQDIRTQNWKSVKQDFRDLVDHVLDIKNC